MRGLVAYDADERSNYCCLQCQRVATVVPVLRFAVMLG